VNEARLDAVCPPGYSLAEKDVCYGAVEGGDLDDAHDTCSARGDRVPTISEASLVLLALPRPTAAARHFTWTSNEFEDTGTGSPDAISMDIDSAGVVRRVDTDQGTAIQYRCVTSPRG
jgi:hypothetical protein